MSPWSHADCSADNRHSRFVRQVGQNHSFEPTGPTTTHTIDLTFVPPGPAVTGVSAVSANGAYNVGDTIIFAVSFDQAVNVDTSGGTPSLRLETGAVDRAATYVSGSGSSTLTFSYTVLPGDRSADLDYIATTALGPNGATLKGSNGLDATLTLPAPGTAGSIGANNAIVIDGIAPTVMSVTVPADGTYKAGQNLAFTVNLSETVLVNTSAGTPQIAVALDTGGTVYASHVSGSGSSALVFRLAITEGLADANGIALSGTIDRNGATIRDAAGNDLAPTMNSVGPTTGVLVDAVRPTAAITVTITFSEAVTGLTTGDFVVANGSLSGLASSDGGVTWTARLTPAAGVSDATNVITLDKTGIADLAGNAGTGMAVSNNYAIDAGAPLNAPPKLTGDLEVTLRRAAATGTGRRQGQLRP